MAYRVFNESQTYRGTWVAYLILLIELPTFLLLLTLFFNAEDKSEIGIALALTVVILGGVLLLIFNIQLETRIDDRGVSFRFFPFVRSWKNFQPGQIKSIEVINYSPISDFGGWGMKGNSVTKAYSVLGDEGLLIDIGEKKKIMIGTANSKELKTFVEYWREENYGS